MAKYYKRPDGLYETSRKVNGRRVYFRGKSCAEVDRKILLWREDAAKGRAFPVVAAEWFAAHEHEATHATLRSYAGTVERCSKHFTQPVGEITALDVKRYIRAFERDGYAQSTVHKELSVLKMIFAYAVFAGDLAVNPAREVTISRGLPKKKRNALTEEQERMVETFRGDNWLFGVMLLYTGCRRGELLALEWRDIDRDAGVIHVTKKLSYSYGNAPVLEHSLKSENGKRDIPLLSPLATVLPRGRIGRIFTGGDGNYLTNSELVKLWNNYLNDVGLPVFGPGRVTPHCFRHSFATICFEAGIDPKDAASFMGDTEEIVRKVYTDLRTARVDRSAKRLDEYVRLRGQA